MPERSKVIPIQLDTNQTRQAPAPVVYFEVADVEVAGRVGDSWLDVAREEPATIEKAGASLDHAVASVEPIVARIMERLIAAGGAIKPKEIEISLGVKLSAKVGFFVAESKGEGSIELKLSYQLEGTADA